MSTATSEGQWDRRRLVRTLLVVVLTVVVLLAGLGYALYSGLTTIPRSRPAPAVKTAAAQLPPGAARRDAIAAAPMMAVDPKAARSGTPAASPGPSITIPSADEVGPAQVPTGYPHTPEGALGQLAAIESTVLQAMSISAAHTVHQAWSDPGAPSVESWELVGDIQAFLASGAGHDDDPLTSVVTTPVGAQVKGTDGPDWVLGCVLLDVQARAATNSRIAYGYCSRMQWSTSAGGRWVIAAGSRPTPAPSTWPGTDLAARAGWRTWVSGPDQ